MKIRKCEVHKDLTWEASFRARPFFHLASQLFFLCSNSLYLKIFFAFLARILVDS